MSIDASSTTTNGRLSALMAGINYVLQTDFCPNFNRWVYWLKKPIWILVLALVGSALCGALVNPWVFVLTGLLSLLVATGVVLPWVAIRRIHCSISFDVPRVPFGTPAMVRVRVRNRWPLPVWGLTLLNGFAPDPDDATPDSDYGVALARVGPWTTLEFRWPFEALRRGIYPRGNAEIETSFPFGLFRARRAVDVTGQLTAWPETIPLTGLPDSVESQQAEEHFSDRRVGEFGDLLGTRPFRQGDSLRRVHWAQTARHQTLIVTERQAPAMSTVRVVVDVRASSHPLPNRRESLDRCVSIAASVCRLLHGHHVRTEFSMEGAERVFGERTSDFHQAMDALARVEVDEQDQQLRDRSRSTFQILITTEHGAVADTTPQIVVETNSEPDKSSKGWITVSDGPAWREDFREQWRRSTENA